VCAQGKVNPAFGWNYFAGLQLLSDRSLLWSGDVFDGDKYWPAWIITDRAGRNNDWEQRNRRFHVRTVYFGPDYQGLAWSVKPRGWFQIVHFVE